MTRALVLNKLGRTSEAFVLLDAALPKLDTGTRSDAAVVSMANGIAARIYRDALLPTKAEARLIRAVSALESSVGRHDKALIDPVMNLGWHYLGQDESERAAPYFMRAYDIAVAKAPKEIADCIQGLARVLDDRKDHKEAIALMLKARSLLEQQPAPRRRAGRRRDPARGGQGGEPPQVQPSGQCSRSSSQAVSLTFRNRSPTVTMNLFWVDFSCNESRYATLAPGDSHVQPTFVSHPWHLRDAGTNALYKEFIPVAGGETLVEVP